MEGLMHSGAGFHAAERETLALYLLGALEDAEREAFETHLAGCWSCLDEAAAVAPSVAGLTWLDEAAVTELPGPGPVVSDPAAHGPAALGASGSPAPRPVRGPAGPRGSRGPAGVRPGTRRRRLWARLGTAAAAAVLVLAGGAVVAGRWAAPDDVVLTGTGEAPAYGASLSVAITTHDTGDSTIRITVTGLRQGLDYRLYAVTRDGATHVIRDWTATTGPHQVAGETSLPIGDLSFITVGPPDGPAIVTAPIAR
jgi:hypothetical protein